jgi:hypothetical protein
MFVLQHKYLQYVGYVHLCSAYEDQMFSEHKHYIICVMVLVGKSKYCSSGNPFARNLY